MLLYFFRRKKETELPDCKLLQLGVHLYTPRLWLHKKRESHAQNFWFRLVDLHAIHNHFSALSSLSLRLILSAREKLQKLFFLSSPRTLHQQEQKYFYRASCF